MPLGRELFKLYGTISMSGVGNVAKELSKVEKQAAKVQREMGRMGRKMASVGKTLTKALTLPAVAAGAAVLKMSADFDAAFKQSTAIMGGLSDTMKNDMKKAALDVSKTLDVSAKKAAEAYFYLASAGMGASQQIDALPVVARFAQAGMFDLARATDLLTDAQSALGLSTKDRVKAMENLNRVSDVLVKANTVANATVEQFSESLTNKAGAALRLLKKDVEEGTAVLAVFADQGLKGAAGGEALNIVLRDLQRASLKVPDVFKRMGVAVFDSSGKMRGMADIIQDLEGLMEGMSDKEKRATLTMLGFQDKSISATQALLGTSEAMRKYEKSLRDAAGFTDEVSSKQLKTFWKRLGLIKNRLAAAVISLDAVGSIGERVVIPFLERVTRVVEKAAHAWGNLSRANKVTIAGFVAVLAAIGPVIFLAGKFILLGKALVPVFIALKAGTLGWAMSMRALSKSVLGTTLVVAAAVAVGWYYYSQWGTISKQLLVIWNRIKLEGIKTFVKLVDSIAASAGDLLQIFSKVAVVYSPLAKKVNAARAGILRFRAALAKTVLAQTQHTAALREEAEGTAGFIKGVKNSVDAIKAKVKVNEELTDSAKELMDGEAASSGASKLAAEERVAAAKKLAEERKRFEKETFDAVNSLRLTDSELLRVQHEERLAEAKRLGADIHAVEQLYSLKKIELQKRELEEEKRSKVSGLRTAANFGGKIEGIFSKFSAAKMKRIDIEEKKQIAAVNRSQMTQEEKERAISKIEERSDKKRQDMERARARREKLFALFQIGINTAAAIVKALPNIALSVAVGAIGAAEAAATMAQPIPFFDGAMIDGSQGGVNAVVGEGNQDELIFPLQRGINLIADGLMDRLSGLEASKSGATGATTELRTPADQAQVNVHIGTFIGDRQGIKELERRLKSVRVEENQRIGV